MQTIAYGYPKRRVNDEGLVELSEVSFSAHSSELRTIAAFFTRCADMMDSDDGFGHEHLRDQPGIEAWDSSASDIIVAKRQ